MLKDVGKNLHPLRIWELLKTGYSSLEILSGFWISWSKPSKQSKKGI